MICEFPADSSFDTMNSGGKRMNNEVIANEELNDAVKIAQFRFGLIAPALQSTYGERSARAYFKRICKDPFRLPDGKEVLYSFKTLEKWTSEYRRKGFESLMPVSRSDKGSSRVLSDEAVSRIYSLKEELPRINATQIHLKLIEEGLIPYDVSVCAVQRFIRNHDLKEGRNPSIQDRKAFEEDSFGKLWQADTKYMPYINEDGASKRVFNISIIDDHSRMIVGGQLFYEDNAVNFQKVLKDAISAYGIPLKLYVDNGSPYANEQLSLICGQLGIVLIHAKVRDGAAKAKIERYWRGVDERLNYVTDMNTITSLKQFNILYRDFVRKYNTSYHNGIKQTPYERYANTNEGIRKAKSREWLDECFLNRIIRKVRLDSTISIDNVFYDVPLQFMKQKVEIRYIPSDMSSAFIFYDSKRYPIRPTNRNENARTKRKSPSIDYERLNHHV